MTRARSDLAAGKRRSRRTSSTAGEVGEQTERALRETQARLLEAEARAHIGSWELDVCSQTGWWSPQVYRMFGRDPGSGPPTLAEFMLLVHPDDRAQVQMAYQRNVQTGCRLTADFRSDPERGRVRCFTLISDAVPGPDGRVTRLAGTVQDVTEQRQTEAVLRESQERFSKAFANSPDCILLTALDGRIIEANDSFTRLTGYTPAEARGRRTLELGLWVDPLDRQRYIEALSEHGRVLDLEASFRHRGGGVRVGLVAGELMELGGETVILGIVRDITERKLAEVEHERLHEELRRSEVMAAMGSLVAGFAHEVRNPLFGITATLDAMEARFGSRDEYTQYLAVLRGEANRLAALVRDLLEYGRPRRLELAPALADAVVAEAVDACAPLAREAGTTILVYGASTVRVAMDRDRLRQAFQNLLQNALQMSPPGGVVTVEIHDVRDDATSGIECLIQDCGPGFAVEDLPRIFEPFFSRRRGGTGLGLSIVQRIVQAHGGTVSESNRPEGGAAIAVWLPAAA